MYKIGETYTVVLKGNITYTGEILEEDELQIRMHTIKDEEVILSKSEISRSFEKKKDEIEKKAIEGEGYIIKVI